MNTAIKTNVPMGEVDQLIMQMEATGFELDTIREHQSGWLFWLLFRRPDVKVVDVDELHLARVGEAGQALRDAEVPPHDEAFVK